MLDYIYHMTNTSLKKCFKCENDTICYFYVALLWTSFHDY